MSTLLSQRKLGVFEPEGILAMHSYKQESQHAAWKAHITESATGLNQMEFWRGTTSTSVRSLAANRRRESNSDGVLAKHTFRMRMFLHKEARLSQVDDACRSLNPNLHSL